MGGYGKHATAAVAVAVVFGALPAGASADVSFNFTKILRGPAKGLVVARGDNARTGVAADTALRGLKSNRRYRIAGSDRTCGNRVDAGDYLIWQFNARSNRSGHLFAAKTVTRHGKLEDVKSVRIFDLDNVGGPEQVACSKNEVAIET